MGLVPFQASATQASTAGLEKPAGLVRDASGSQAA